MTEAKNHLFCLGCHTALFACRFSMQQSRANKQTNSQTIKTERGAIPLIWSWTFFKYKHIYLCGEKKVTLD
jgi:hypothetical protein